MDNVITGELRGWRHWAENPEVSERSAKGEGLQQDSLSWTAVKETNDKQLKCTLFTAESVKVGVFMT